MSVERVPVESLKTAPWNPRSVRDERFSQLCRSLEADPDFLEQRPILAQADGTVYAGNHRLLAARHLGWATVPAIVADVPDLIAKQRAMVDNNSAADWAEQDLAALLSDLETDGTDLSLLGFEAGELDRLLGLVGEDGDAEPVGGDPNALLARAEEWVKAWSVESGQLWIAGRHRLICGDSRDREQIARLLDGESPDLAHTDPPYGIGIVNAKRLTAADLSGGSKPFGSTSGSERKSGAAFRSTGRVPAGPSRNSIIQSNIYPVIEGDDVPFDPAPLLGIAPVVILWGANHYADRLPVSDCWIVWDKREDITRNSFSDCELAWCSKKGPARLFHHLWNGLHKGSQHGEGRTHPTEKPVALFAEIGGMFAPDGLWLDLYAGTGAQIVAAEQSGARCYAAEIEPLYVATTLQRLADMGLEPRRA